jgi:hypothetical protein
MKAARLPASPGIILKFNRLRSYSAVCLKQTILAVLMPDHAQSFSNLSGDFLYPEQANLGEE